MINPSSSLQNNDDTFTQCHRSKYLQAATTQTIWTEWQHTHPNSPWLGKSWYYSFTPMVVSTWNKCKELQTSLLFYGFCFNMKKLKSILLGYCRHTISFHGFHWFVHRSINKFTWSTHNSRLYTFTMMVWNSLFWVFQKEKWWSIVDIQFLPSRH